MSTTPTQNAFLDILGGTLQMPFSTAVPFNQGDMLWFDTKGTAGNGAVLRPITTDAQGASSVGVSGTTNPITSISPTQYPTPQFAVVYFNQIFKFNSTTGDTYNWLDPLYIGATSQTLTNQTATNAIGRIHFPPSDPNGNVITPPLAGGAGVILYAAIKPLLTTLGIL